MKGWNTILRWFWLNLSQLIVRTTGFLTHLVIMYGGKLLNKLLDGFASRLHDRVPPDIEVAETLLEFNTADDDCPEFLQIINLPDGSVLGIQKIIRCPDETAVVRILTEKDYSKPFNRKVYGDIWKGKYIKLDNQKYFITKAIAQSS